MAQTVLLALSGSLLFAFTVVPALLALVLRGKVAESENRLMRGAVSLYRPVLGAALRWRWAVVASGAALIVLCGVLAARMGSEFVPSLKEGTITVQPLRIPSISLTKSIEMQAQVEELLLREFPDEIERTYARIGTAEIATDPAGPDHSDGNLMLRPRSRWKRAKSQDELAAEVQEVLERLPGQNYEITQPIQLRFNELISGIKSDLAVKVFGDDLDVMRTHAQQIAGILGTLRGASDVRVEQVSGLPVLTIAIDRAAISRYGLNVSDVHAVIETAIGGSTVGQVFEGDRRFDLVVRLPEEIRTDIHALEHLPIPLSMNGGAGAGPLVASLGGDPELHAAYVPLGSVSRISIEEGPNQIGRENGKRRVVVTANVRGRDIGSFVEEAQTRIGAEVTLPAGYWTTWGGQFENLLAARRRLAFVVPLALALIFLLLFTTFGSVRPAVLVFTGVPLALTGGVIALLLRGIPLSISAGVGFIALSGVAVLNGLVMVTFIRELSLSGMPLEEAIRVGSRTRLRPVLMTALVASLGFVPMALAHGTGAEVQRPLATVVIGGIISSTLLTLVVLPALYRLFHGPDEGGVRP
jgi:cobalt-zinc-cadmium resistance protein CzcA